MGISENKNGQTDEKNRFVHLVTRPGFEPRQAESESAVLPLYYRAILTGNFAISFKPAIYSIVLYLPSLIKKFFVKN